jgi:hypothetical protein
VTDFFSELKSASSGFASFDYEEAGYERSDLVKLNILLNSKPVDALAMIVHRSAAQAIGGDWCKKLKKVVPKQMFELAIQAAIGTKVVARETISANRKDVTAGLYGGGYKHIMIGGPLLMIYRPLGSKTKAARQAEGRKEAIETPGREHQHAPIGLLRRLILST